MQAIGQSIKDYSYRGLETKNSIAIVKDNLCAKDADAIIADCSDLIDDKRFNPFFYKKLYALGKDRFLEQAYKARKYGNRKGAYFVHLLK